MALEAFISLQQDMMNYATNNLDVFHTPPQDLDPTMMAIYTPAGLSPDQYSIFSAVREQILSNNHNMPKMFFVDGPGGTGKSHLFNTIIHYLEKDLGRPVIAVATSGIAALLLHGGRTAHSTFKIPILIRSDTLIQMAISDPAALPIINAACIIYDEAPMQHRHVFDAVDKLLRDLMAMPNTPFGGKVIVFSGDFHQVLPVLKFGSAEQIKNASLSNSLLWPQIVKVKLTMNMRV